MSSGRITHGRTPCPVCGHRDPRCTSQPSTRTGGGLHVLCYRAEGRDHPEKHAKHLGEVNGGPGGHQFHVLPGGHDGQLAADALRQLDEAKRRGRQDLEPVPVGDARAVGFFSSVRRWTTDLDWNARGQGALLDWLERKGLEADPDLYAAFPVGDDLERFLREGESARWGGLALFARRFRALRGEPGALEFHLDENGRPHGVRLTPFDGPVKSLSAVGFSPRLHHAPGWRERVQSSGELVIAEGSRKANVIGDLTGCGAIATNGLTPSAENWTLLEQRILDARPRVVTVALDAADLLDGAANHDRTRAAAIQFARLRAAAKDVDAELRFALWGLEFGKGPDDALLELRRRGWDGPGWPARVTFHGFDAWVESMRWSDAPGAEKERSKALAKLQRCFKEQAKAREASLPHRLDPNAPAMTVSEARAGGLEQALLEAINSPKGQGAITVLDPPVGTGKTRTIAAIVVRDPGHYAVFVSNYRLRDELVEAIRVLAPSVPIALPEGVSKACSLGPDLLAGWGAQYDDEGHVTRRPRLPGYWRKSVCSGCPLKSTCAAHAKPKEGDLIVAVSHLDEHIPDPEVAAIFDEQPIRIMRGRTVIYDENPATVVTRQVSQGVVLDPVENLNRYSIDGGDDEERKAHLDVVRRGTRALRAVLERLTDGRRAENTGKPSSHQDCRYPSRIKPSAEHFKEEELEALRLLARNVDRGRLHRPSGEAVMDGRVHAGNAPHMELVDVWQALARAMDAVPEAGCPDESVEFVVSDDHVAVDLARPQPLVVPQGGRTLVLDATIGHVLDEIVAANRGIQVHKVPFNVVPDPGAAPVHRIYVQARGVSRSSLLSGGELPSGKKQRARSLGRIRNPLQVAAEKVRELGLDPESLELGLLAFKAIASGLTGAAADLEAVMEGGHGCGGWQLHPDRIGHWGGNSRGTNRFEGCDVLVTVGQPSPNLGSVQHEAEALGMPGADLARSRTLAELEQGLGRLRPLNPEARERVLIHIGADEPTSWVGDESVVRLSVQADDWWADGGCETACAALGNWTPLRVLDLGEVMPPGAIGGGYSTRRHYSRTAGEATRKRAHRHLEDLQEMAREVGLGLVVEAVPIPGKRGKAPLVVRPEGMSPEEAGQLLAAQLEEPLRAPTIDADPPGGEIQAPPAKVQHGPAQEPPTPVEGVANGGQHSPTPATLGTPPAPAEEPLAEPEAFPWGPWEEPVEALEPAALVDVGAPPTASREDQAPEELAAGLMDHVELRRAFEDARTFDLLRAADDPMEVLLEGAGPPMPVWGATYIPARQRFAVTVVVHGLADALGLQLSAAEVHAAVPEFVHDDAPAESGLGMLRRWVLRDAPIGAAYVRIGREVLADLLFDGVLGDEERAEVPRAGGFNLTTPTMEESAGIAVAGYPAFREHDAVTVSQFSRPDPCAPRWAAKHDERRKQGAARAAPLPRTA